MKLHCSFACAQKLGIVCGKHGKKNGDRCLLARLHVCLSICPPTRRFQAKAMKSWQYSVHYMSADSLLTFIISLPHPNPIIKFEGLWKFGNAKNFWGAYKWPDSHFTAAIRE